jgi:hypothetical protein
VTSSNGVIQVDTSGNVSPSFDPTQPIINGSISFRL